MLIAGQGGHTLPDTATVRQPLRSDNPRRIARINRRMYCSGHGQRCFVIFPTRFVTGSCTPLQVTHYGTLSANVGLEVIKTLLKGQYKSRYHSCTGGRFAPRWIETGAHMLRVGMLESEANG